MQMALYDGADDVPLPEAPETPENEVIIPEASVDSALKGKGQETAKDSKKKSKWSFLRRDSRDTTKRKAKNATATDLKSAAEQLKSPDAQPNEDGIVSDPEAKKEEEEMSALLDDLNLAAVNNRVFSVSKESKDLLHKFTLVLKDLMNGVPTAYNYLESLLTNSENQLQRSYSHMPPFLQKLIEQLPEKMTESIGPEVLAAAAEKHGVKSKYAQPAASTASKMGLKVKVPSLKDLVTKPGAVAGILKAIMNFLKLRFPAFLGLNVLYSLGLFVLMLLFWYCHKRGREVRLEKEKLLAESESTSLNDEREEVILTPTTHAETEHAESSTIDDQPATNLSTSAPTEQVEAEEPVSTTEDGYAKGGSLAIAMEMEKREKAKREREKARPEKEEKKGEKQSEKSTEPELVPA